MDVQRNINKAFKWKHSNLCCQKFRNNNMKAARSIKLVFSKSLLCI